MRGVEQSREDQTAADMRVEETRPDQRRMGGGVERRS